jgi:hypothetical protein
MKKLVALISIMAAMTIGPAWADWGVAGNWNVTTKTPQRTRKATVMINQQGGIYTGKIRMDKGSVSALKDVKVRGSEISFVRDMDTANGSVMLTYAGKVKGDKIAGTVQSRFGENPFRGTRQKD